MPRIINFEGRKITVPDDASDDEVAGILGGSAAPPPAAPTHTSQALGFEQGVGNFLSNAAQPAIWAGKKLGFDMGGFEDGQNVMRNPEHAPDVAPGKIGRFAADVLESAPLAALAPAGLAGTMAAGAGTGALTADPGHQTEGAVLGGGGAGLLHGIGNMIAPHVSDAVQRLAAEGVQMTPGQLLGGITKGLEDRAAGLPLIGDFITSGQNRSLESFGRASANRALAPLGQAAPGDLAGHDLVAHAGDQLSDAYNTLLPQMNVSLGGPFAAKVNNAGGRVAARLPDEMSGQFQGVLGDVFKKMSAGQPGPSNTFGGRAVKDATTDLGTSARSYAGSADANQRELGGAFGSVNDALNQAVRDSNPQFGRQLDNINQGWSNLVPVERAAASATGNASGRGAGVFSPQQLRAAVRTGDNSVRDRAMARGTVPMQQLAEDGIQVLPQSVGDSGTAGRNAVGALLAGGVAHLINPGIAAAGLAIPAIYSQPGMALATRLLGRAPGPVQTGLGSLFQNLGKYGAGPAAGALTTRAGQ